MRAKELAARYKNNPTNQEIASIMRDLVLEMKDIADRRGAFSNSAMSAIFDEQAQKSKAFLRLAGLEDKIKDNAFELYIKTVTPELWSLWMIARMDK